MESSDLKLGPAEVVLYVVGGAGAAYAIWKAVIDGFYPSEAMGIFIAAIIGAACVLIATRLTAKRKHAAADAADRSRGVE